MNKLTAKKRSKTDKLAEIRNNGMLPAVVYGAKIENTLISISKIDFQKIFKTAGETSTIVLELEDEKTKTNQKVDVLIHDVQIHPVKNFPIHVDFLAVDMNKEIEVSVPIEFIGLAQAEKDGLGVLVKVLHEIEVKALPKNIPSSIQVDISILKELDQQIQAKDLKIPKDVSLLTEKDEVVALIAPIEEEIVEETSIDLSAIEVEKKGKKEETTEEQKEENQK